CASPLPAATRPAARGRFHSPTRPAPRRDSRFRLRQRRTTRQHNPGAYVRHGARTRKTPTDSTAPRETSAPTTDRKTRRARWPRSRRRPRASPTRWTVASARQWTSVRRLPLDLRLGQPPIGRLPTPHVDFAAGREEILDSRYAARARA